MTRRAISGGRGAVAAALLASVSIGALAVSAKAEDKFAKADADHSGGLNPKEFATTKVERKSKPGCSCQKQDGRKGDDNE